MPSCRNLMSVADQDFCLLSHELAACFATVCSACIGVYTCIKRLCCHLADKPRHGLVRSLMSSINIGKLDSRKRDSVWSCTQAHDWNELSQGSGALPGQQAFRFLSTWQLQRRLHVASLAAGISNLLPFLEQLMFFGCLRLYRVYLS